MRTAPALQSTHSRSTLPAIRLAAFASAIALVFAACGGDKATGLSGNVYTLASVSGNTLPWEESQTDTIPASGSTAATIITFTYGFKSGQLALQSGNKFEADITIHDKVASTNNSVWQSYDSTTVQKTIGTYSISGSTISLTSPDTTYNSSGQPVVANSTITGSYSTSQITLADTSAGGATLVFKK